MGLKRITKMEITGIELKNHRICQALYCVTILLFLTSCSKDDEAIFPITAGDRLVKLSEYYQNAEHKTQQFIYNEKNQLEKIQFKTEYPGILYRTGEQFFSYDNSGRRTEKIKTYHNANLYGLPLEKATYNYNEQSLLWRVNYHRSYDGGVIFDKGIISGREYHYNDNGELGRKQVFFRDTIPQTSWSFEIENYYYIWDEGNIVEVEEYNRNGELLYSKFYEYDNKLNYQFENPSIFIYPEARTVNNVVRVTIIDHFGYLPFLHCHICQITFQYNQIGQPVSFISQKLPNRKFVLTYE